jgi:hypothetical protein
LSDEEARARVQLTCATIRRDHGRPQMSTSEAPSYQRHSQSAWTKSQTEKKGKLCADASEQQCGRQMAAASPMQQLQQLSAARQRIKAHRSAKQRQLGQIISPRCICMQVSQNLLQQHV